MILKEYPDREMMMMDLASVLVGELNSALMTHDRASFAVPGGTTPGPVFDALCAADMDWQRVTVLLTDERWVPEDAPRSNTRLVKDRLFKERAADAQFFGYYSGEEDVDTAVARLSTEIEPFLPISVLLLGMGGDMHTASLFPGAEGLDRALADDADPVLAIRGGGATEPRVTLSAKVLRGAISTHILITGPEKRAALEKARHIDDPALAPVATVLKNAIVHWAE